MNVVCVCVWQMLADNRPLTELAECEWRYGGGMACHGVWGRQVCPQNNANENKTSGSGVIEVESSRGGGGGGGGGDVVCAGTLYNTLSLSPSR